MDFIHTLCFLAICVTILAMVRFGYTQYYLKRYELQQKGHLCSRLRRMGSISMLDVKYMNYGLVISQDTHRSGTAYEMMEEYDKYFYEVPDSDIDFDTLLPKIKTLIQDLKENGERDILFDFMNILRNNVNLMPWLQKNKKRQRLWNLFCNKLDAQTT